MNDLTPMYIHCLYVQFEVWLQVLLCCCRDMFGAVTQPLKVTRTIITGQSSTLVCRLLYLLTYFIRSALSLLSFFSLFLFSLYLPLLLSVNVYIVLLFSLCLHTVLVCQLYVHSSLFFLGPHTFILIDAY